MFLLGRDTSRRLRATTGWLFAPFGDAGMGLATAFRARLAGLGAEELSPGQVRQLRRRNEQLQRTNRALEAELSFYGQVFGFDPAGDIEAVEVEGR